MVHLNLFDKKKKKKKKKAGILNHRHLLWIITSRMSLSVCEKLPQTITSRYCHSHRIRPVIFAPPPPPPPLDRAVFGPFRRAHDSICSGITSSNVDAIVNKLTYPKFLNEASVQVCSRVNVVTGFQSMEICDWNLLAIPSTVFQHRCPSIR